MQLMESPVLYMYQAERYAAKQFDKGLNKLMLNHVWVLK